MVWACQVLGALVDPDVLRGAIDEIDRVLAPGGLVFLAEDTTDRADLPYWAYRSTDEYASLLDFVELERRGTYRDGDDDVTVLAGRRIEP